MPWWSSEIAGKVLQDITTQGESPQENKYIRTSSLTPSPSLALLLSIVLGNAARIASWEATKWTHYK